MIFPNNIYHLTFFLFLSQMSLFFSSIWYSTPKKRFSATKKIAVVIPAHNEEKVIHKTVLSFINQGFTVFVVSDKCSDNTVEESLPARVYVCNEGNKYRALRQFCLSNFEELKEFDYVGFFDADSRAIRSSSFVSRYLPDTPSYLVQFAFSSYSSSFFSSLYDFLFSFSFALNKGLDVLFKNAILMGSGFFVPVPFLKKLFSVSINSLVDDYELSLKMPFTTRFVAIPVYASFNPFSYKDAFRQRVRWSRGYFQLLFDPGSYKFFLKRLYMYFFPVSIFVGVVLSPLYLLSYLNVASYWFLYAIFIFILYSSMFKITRRKFRLYHFLALVFFFIDNILVSIVAFFTFRNHKWYRSMHSGSKGSVRGGLGYEKD